MNKKETNIEQATAEVIKNYLGDGFSVEVEPHGMTIFDMSYRPDISISYYGKPLAIVDVHSCSYELRPALFASPWYMERVCRREQLAYGVMMFEDMTLIMQEADDYKLTEVNSLDGALNIIKERMSLITETDVTKVAEAFLDYLKKVSKSIGFQDKHSDAKIQKMTIDDLDWQNVTSTATRIALSPDFERKLFLAILGEYNNRNVCRYTTKSSLFRILNDQKQSLCGLSCMNDKSECYYADRYLMERGNKLVSDKLTYTDAKQLNRYFITSCSRLDEEDLDTKMYDDLSMWRMYGDDCRGVCMKFHIDEDLLGDKFILAPISYAKRHYETERYYDLDDPDGYVDEITGENAIHPELNFIHSVMYSKVCGYQFLFSTFDLWKHFFKTVEYRNEKEIRLLYIASEDDKLKWVNANEVFCPVVEKDITEADGKRNEYPLVLDKVILGPKFSEADVNVSQVELMVEDKEIKRSSDFECEKSKIDNYR